MKGEIVLVDEISYDLEDFSIIPGSGLFSLSIYVNSEHDFETQLKNRAKFDECMELTRDYHKTFGVEASEEEKEIRYIEEHFDNLFDEVEFVKLSFATLNAREYLDKHPILLSKKIVIDEYIKVNDYEKIQELMDTYLDIIDQVYVLFEGNDNYIGLSDCYKTIKELQDTAEKVLSLKLSPMERVMYIYDKVRNRIYTEEQENESKTKSRDLTEVLFGDKIVCAGYANIFSALLKDIGIDNQIVHLVVKDKDGNVTSAHARNEAYIVDPKYDIDGVYYFDATWDSKREEQSNLYLSSYRHFAKTKSYMDSLSNHEDKQLPNYSEEMYNEIESIIINKDYQALTPYVHMINYMLKIANEDNKINVINLFPTSPFYADFDAEALLVSIKNAFKKFAKDIPAETMVLLLNNVRKIEYYQEPDWYPYTLNDLYHAFLCSEWAFADIHMNSKERLLAAIFGETTREKNPKADFLGYSENNGIQRKIEEIRFTKTLAKVLEKRIANK